MVEHVLTAYGIRADLVERIEAGCINQTFRVTVGERQYALRRYRRNNPRFIAREQLVMQTARDAGTPAPELLPTRDGELILRADGALWSLMTWLPGEIVTPRELTLGRAYRLGEAVGRMHSALAHLNPALFPAAPQHSGVEPEATLEAIATFRRIMALKPDSFSERGMAYCDLIEPRLVAGSPALPYFRTAPRQVLHGDLWYLNVLFEGSDVSGLLDWEYACAAPRLWELSYAFGCWLLILDDLETTVDLTSEFLQGYASKQRLTAEEAALVPEVYRWFRMNHMGIFYNRYVLGDPRTDIFLAPNIRQITLIEEMGSMLSDRLARALAPGRRRGGCA